MSDQGNDADQRRDARLQRLLKTPPQSRPELAETVRREKGKKPKLPPTQKAKERPASKGRVHKGKARI
jgi:hypothetical protein